VTTNQDLDAIYQAKLDGISDEKIMKKFSVGLKEIEKAVIRRRGVNLNLFVDKPKITRLAPKDFRLESTSVWSFKNRGKWATHSGNYRGNWSPYIPRNVILMYSKPGDIVLDQFCGGGTTAVEAKLLGRRCIARDINQAAIQLTFQNLNFSMSTQESLVETENPTEFYEPEVSEGDARRLDGIENESVDLICTHPPYADIIQYTDEVKGDISFHKIDEFIEDMKAVAEECYRVLKPDGVCSILIGDTRKKKRVVPMGFRTIEAFLEQGFILKDLIIKRQHNCRTTGFWYSSSIKHNFLLLAQEYLPIFIKPDSNASKSRKKRSKISYRTKKVKIPPLTDKMQCKTTWVLPSDSYEELIDRNVLNRYGGNGQVLRIQPSEEKGDSCEISKEQYDMVYVDPVMWKGKPDLGAYARMMVDLVNELVTRVSDGGHIVIRTRDIRQLGSTASPALSLWRVPNEHFQIREIIVATIDKVPSEQVADDISVAHEFLLVYQKPLEM
jgi:DNA modification methylase